MKISRTRVPEQCAFDAMVGANLQYIRKFRKLSMKKVAEQIPFTFQQLGKYEKGDNTISAYKLNLLRKIYDVGIDKIIRPDFIEKHQEIFLHSLDQKLRIEENDPNFVLSAGISSEEIKAVDKEHTQRQLRK